MCRPGQVPLLILFALVLALMLQGCQEDQTDVVPVSVSQHTRPVRVMVVEERMLPVIYPVPGTVVPSQRLQVASRISGYIEQIEVDEGDVVEPGALLLAIDDARVEAAIKASEATLTATQADLQDARDDVMRYRSLASTQALAEDQLRDAQLRQVQAKADLIKVLAELQANRRDRRYIRITSPVRAQVRERLRDPGDLAVAGEPILLLDVLGPMELEVFLPSTRIATVAEGQAVDIYLQSDGSLLSGRIKRIVNSADTVTRSSKVRIALPTDRELSPGQFGHAYFILGQDKVPAIPTAAIVERAGIEGVFLVEGSDRVRFRSIRTGRAWQDYREVLAGIDAGMLVVLDPPNPLRDGDRIKRTSPNGN